MRTSTDSESEYNPLDITAIYNEDYADSYSSAYLDPWRGKHNLNVENLERLRRDMGLEEALRWLDVACGQAWHFTRIPDMVDKVGIDLSRAQLDKARQANPTAEFVQGDMSQRLLVDEEFDLVTSFWGAYCYLNSYCRIKAFLYNMIRWTKPGGAIYLEILLSDALKIFNGSGYADRTGFRVIPRTPDCSRWSYRDVGGLHVMTSPPLEFFVEQLSRYFLEVELKHDSGFMVHAIATGKRMSRWI